MLISVKTLFFCRILSFFLVEKNLSHSMFLIFFRLFLIFDQKWGSCSYKIGSYKNNWVLINFPTFDSFTMREPPDSFVATNFRTQTNPYSKSPPWGQGRADPYPPPCHAFITLKQTPAPSPLWTKHIWWISYPLFLFCLWLPQWTRRKI